MGKFIIIVKMVIYWPIWMAIRRREKHSFLIAWLKDIYIYLYRMNQIQRFMRAKSYQIISQHTPHRTAPHWIVAHSILLCSHNCPPVRDICWPTSIPKQDNENESSISKRKKITNHCQWLYSYHEQNISHTTNGDDALNANRTPRKHIHRPCVCVCDKCWELICPFPISYLGPHWCFNRSILASPFAMTKHYAFALRSSSILFQYIHLSIADGGNKIFSYIIFVFLPLFFLSVWICIKSEQQRVHSAPKCQHSF